MAGGSGIDKEKARKDGACFNYSKKSHMANRCLKRGLNKNKSKEQNDYNTAEKANSAAVACATIHCASMSLPELKRHNSEEWYSADNIGIEVQLILEGTKYKINKLEASVYEIVTEVAT
jgi:hypothetical protein